MNRTMFDTDILLCPICCRVGVKLSYNNELLQCEHCSAVFPVIDNVPRLLNHENMQKFISSYKSYYDKLSNEEQSLLPLPLVARQQNKLFIGLGGQDYHQTRIKNPVIKYSLSRRIEAVSEFIGEYLLKQQRSNDSVKLLELGCADGLLGKALVDNFDFKNIVGVDLQDDQLKHNQFLAVQGDCQNLPFKDNSFDILVGAALVEHIPSTSDFLKECYRVLRPEGLLVLTCPVPFYDWVCTKIGYFKNANHLHRFSIAQLKILMQQQGFVDNKGKKFMLSPFKNTIFEAIEKSFLSGALSFFMLNQVVCGQKPFLEEK